MQHNTTTRFLDDIFADVVEITQPLNRCRLKRFYTSYRCILVLKESDLNTCVCFASYHDDPEYSQCPICEKKRLWNGKPLKTFVYISVSPS